MDRRAFLRGAALLSAGVLAADQLELVDRLGWTRRFFPGWSMPTLYADGIHDDTVALQALFDGRSVRRPNGAVLDGHRFFLRDERFRLTGTVFIGRTPGLSARDRVVTRCTFIVPPLMDARIVYPHVLTMTT